VACIQTNWNSFDEKQRMNNFHIYEEIGRGNGSHVYKGRKRSQIEYVAIKSVNIELKQRVLNEVSVQYSLEHPNIVKFINWYETTKHIWLILEYCTGGDLLSLLRQDDQLPEKSIRLFGHDIMSGLQYLHSRGYIYGDLKPSNVLINEYGILKLCDFGLSSSIATQLPVKPGSLSKRGTPYYMAPELFHAKFVHSFASDIWAFGSNAAHSILEISAFD
jgi:serine/threonine-protein kinase ULK4